MSLLSDMNFDFQNAKDEACFASEKFKCIMREIKDFEDGLDNRHEVGVYFASFGVQTLMAVQEIGYHNPDLMFFYGWVNGKSAQLIQHISQLNFLLTAVEKADPNAPPRRIGFDLPSED